MSQIKLAVGLGNPGSEYAKTRHNIGAWFIQTLADQYHTELKFESKFKGFFGTIRLENNLECKLLLPTTYMNCSGSSVLAVSKFYKITANEILIAQDELDFSPGIAKLKFGGGDNNHNGIKDIKKHLNTGDFYRLRFGIGRPHDRNFIDYVLNKPSKADAEFINNAINKALTVFPQLVAGEVDKAMQFLHS